VFYQGKKKPHAILPAAVLLVGDIAICICAHKEVKHLLHILKPGASLMKYRFS
jgi:hypothetical protein